MYQGKVDLYDNSLILDWKLTTRCNYRCSYCFFQKGNLDVSLNNVVSTIDNLKKLRNIRYHVVLSGGEATLLPTLSDIYGMISDRLPVSSIRLTTNGTASPQFYAGLAQRQDIQYLFYISVHPEYADIIHLKNVIEALLPLPNTRVYLALMYLVPNIHKYMELTAYHSISNNFQCGLVLLRGGNFFEQIVNYEKTDLVPVIKINTLYCRPTIPYRWVYDDESQIFNVEPSTALVQNLVDFRNMWCCGSTAFLNVFPDGRCKGSECILSKPSLCSLYNVLTYKEPKFMEPIKCTRKICGCRGNLIIPKFRDRDAAIKYVSTIRETIL